MVEAQSEIIAFNQIGSFGDRRLVDLLSLAKVRNDPDDPRKDIVWVHTFPNGNIYCAAIVVHSESRVAAESYFGRRLDWEPRGSQRSPICNDEIRSVISTSQVVEYMKESEGGLVQVAGFGIPWASPPDTNWALYGHILQR